MVILTRLVSWIVTPIGTYVAGALLLLVAWQGNNYYQRQKGASEAFVRVKEADKRNVEKVETAARKSRANTSGVLDPYRRAD